MNKELQDRINAFAEECCEIGYKAYKAKRRNLVKQNSLYWDKEARDRNNKLQYLYHREYHLNQVRDTTYKVSRALEELSKVLLEIHDTELDDPEA